MFASCRTKDVDAPGFADIANIPGLTYESFRPDAKKSPMQIDAGLDETDIEIIANQIMTLRSEACVSRPSRDARQTRPNSPIIKALPNSLASPSRLETLDLGATIPSSLFAARDNESVDRKTSQQFVCSASDGRMPQSRFAMSSQYQQLGFAFPNVLAKRSAWAAIDKMRADPLSRLGLNLLKDLVKYLALGFIHVFPNIFGLLPAFERDMIGVDQLKMRFREEFCSLLKRLTRRRVEIRCARDAVIGSGRPVLYHVHRDRGMANNVVHRSPQHEILLFLLYEGTPNTPRPNPASYASKRALITH